MFSWGEDRIICPFTLTPQTWGYCLSKIGSNFEKRFLERLSPEQKKIQLYLEQKKTLEAFLERGAISKAQFDKSLGDLTVKMGMSGLAE